MLYLTIFTIVLFVNLFFVFAYLLQYILPKQTPLHSYFEVSNEIVSSLQALAAASVGLATVLATKNDILLAQYWPADAYVYIWMGYCYYDLWSMYYSHCIKHDKKLVDQSLGVKIKSFITGSFLSFIIHHVLFGFVVLPLWLVLSKGRGHFFCGCLMLDSLSNPFVNLRTVLVKLNLKETKTYRINFILMTVAFFICKILLLPFMFSSYARMIGISIFNVPFKLPRICAGGSLVLFGMYLFWFIPMLKGTRKYIFVKNDH